MKKKLVTALAGIVGLVALFFVVRGISNYIYGQTDDAAYNQEADLPEAKAAMTEDEIQAFLDGVKKDGTDASGVEESAEASEPEEEQTEEIPIDFEELWELNPDVYAWIRIPGTEIDYPILQHESDDSYYLNYNIDGSYGRPGCIYTEKKFNNKEFTDNNTVIYGHNMNNGTMFAQLHKFEDREFFDENREVIIYMPDRVLHYKIFAAHVYDDRHLNYSFDFTDKEVYGEYLESVFAIRDMSANIDTEMAVTAENKIITLSTCVYKQKDKRYLVHAVLLEDEND